MKKLLIVSCTQRKDKKQTLLYKSIEHLKECGVDFSAVDIQFITDNKAGLSEVYNRFLTPVIQEQYKIALFVHDDVWIDDALLVSKLCDAVDIYKYDIIGLAGTLNPKLGYPSLWHLMGNRADHRGYAGHYTSQGSKIMTGFGPTPSRVVLVDGLFIAVNIEAVLKANWTWNENFTFHHYDLASCLDANAKKLAIGVYPITVFHASPGLHSLDDVAWSKSNTKFLEIYS